MKYIYDSERLVESKHFYLVRSEGVGINDTPWKGMTVINDDIADEYAVEVRLETSNRPDFNGNPVQYLYKGSYVSYGLVNGHNSLSDTLKFIEILQDAIKFCKDIDSWFESNQ